MSNNDDSEPLNPPLATVVRRGRFTTVCSCAFIAAYIGVNLYFLAKNAVGDISSQPLAYFFTWDMFPGYSCYSVRRMAIGQTSRGEWVQLYPTSRQRFRRGMHREEVLPANSAGKDPGGAARADIDRSGQRFRQLVDHELKQAEAELSEDPVVRVYLLEAYWAKRMNLPDDLYESWSGDRKPLGKYWRIVSEYEAGHAG